MINDMKKNILYFIILTLTVASCSSSRYVLRPPDDDKWKCITAIHITDSTTIEITQKAKLTKGEKVEVRLIRSVPFQDLETLPERRGLDDLIRDKNCSELSSILTGISTMPITYLDSGPLDLSPKNSKRIFKVTKGYELIVRTNSPKAKILIKQIK